MIRIDPSNWTADFRIARALAEAFSASGTPEVVFFCTGEPNDDVGCLGSLVADETKKYFAHVVGTSDAPITPENYAESARAAMKRWPEAFVVVIEAGLGRAAHLGSIEITDRPPTTIADGSVPRLFGDVTVNAVLRLDEGFVGADAGEPRGNTAGLAAAKQEVGSDDAPGIPERSKFKPLRPDQITRSAVRKIADVVIDGNLRFLSKIGKQEL